jgi:hypothetical protein
MDWAIQSPAPSQSAAVTAVAGRRTAWIARSVRRDRHTRAVDIELRMVTPIRFAACKRAEAVALSASGPEPDVDGQ